MFYEVTLLPANVEMQGQGQDEGARGLAPYPSLLEGYFASAKLFK